MLLFEDINYRFYNKTSPFKKYNNITISSIFKKPSKLNLTQILTQISEFVNKYLRKIQPMHLFFEILSISFRSYNSLLNFLNSEIYIKINLQYLQYHCHSLLKNPCKSCYTAIIIAAKKKKKTADTINLYEKLLEILN